MSLINDMLRDLDARRDQPRHQQQVALQGLGLTLPHKITPIPFARLLQGIGLALLLAATAIVGWQLLTPSQPDPIVESHATAVLIEPATTIAAPESVEAAIPAAIARPQQTTATAATQSNTTNTTPAMIRKTPRPLSSADKTELAYQRASLAIRQGRRQEAIAALQQTLVLQPLHTQARLALAGAWIENGQMQRAQEVLAAGIDRQPSSTALAKLYGHLLVQQGDYSRARRTLEAAAMGARQDADYQALLGTLYQRIGAPEQAALAYRRALTLRPDQGVWWIGLGIAQEQAQRHEQAREAFGTALRHTLTPALRRYAQGRRQSLHP